MQANNETTLIAQSQEKTKELLASFREKHRNWKMNTLISLEIQRMMIDCFVDKEGQFEKDKKVIKEAKENPMLESILTTIQLEDEALKKKVAEHGEEVTQAKRQMLQEKHMLGKEEKFPSSKRYSEDFQKMIHECNSEQANDVTEIGKIYDELIAKCQEMEKWVRDFDGQ